jgi:hypothetical protein
MTEKSPAKNWSDENVATLLSIVGAESPVSVEAVEAAATQLNKTPRSIASKLRQLDREVASMAKEKTATFSVEESEALTAYVTANAGTMTYKDIAETFSAGRFSAKQVQGKLLALELTSLVKPAEKAEAARTYTAEEETAFIAMANAGAFIEDIASAMGKSVNSARGKALSLLRSTSITSIPAQKESHAVAVVDPVSALGDKIATMTVAEIAQATDKTERGTKTMLTRRGIDCADYKGKTKKEKAEARVA